MSEIHPLDREDDDDLGSVMKSSIADTPQGKSPLRPLVIIAIINGSLLMISSIWMNNASFDSTNYRIAEAVNRVLMVILLLSFVGMLIYYQRKSLQKIYQNLLAQSNPRAAISQVGVSSDSNSQPNNNSSNPIVINEVATIMPSPMNMTPRPLSLYPMFVLIAANIVLLIVLWCVGLLLSGLPMPWFLSIFSASITLLPGLLICMIIWNRGMMRAYAVGLLTTHLTTGLGLMAMIAGGGMGRSYYNQPYGYQSGSWEFASTLGFHWTMVIFGGLVPACYIALLTYFRSRQEKSQS